MGYFETLLAQNSKQTLFLLNNEYKWLFLLVEETYIANISSVWNSKKN